MLSVLVLVSRWINQDPYRMPKSNLEIHQWLKCHDAQWPSFLAVRHGVQRYGQHESRTLPIGTDEAAHLEESRE